MEQQPLTIDTPCPVCGEESLDSLDSDDNAYKHVDQWSCGNCEAQFDQEYRFVEWRSLGD